MRRAPSAMLPLSNTGTLAMTETTLSVRLPAEFGARLDRLARSASVSKSKLAKDAIVAYLDEQERQLEKIREGLDDAEAGRVLSHEVVTRWLESWGTEDELPPPKCG
jgi:predicted transcriptional regulator